MRFGESQRRIGEIGARSRHRLAQIDSRRRRQIGRGRSEFKHGLKSAVVSDVWIDDSPNVLGRLGSSNCHGRDLAGGSWSGNPTTEQTVSISGHTAPT